MKKQTKCHKYVQYPGILVMYNNTKCALLKCEILKRKLRDSPQIYLFSRLYLVYAVLLLFPLYFNTFIHESGSVPCKAEQCVFIMPIADLSEAPLEFSELLKS